MRKTAQAVTRHNAVTRNDGRKRIGRARLPHGARRAAQLDRSVAIGAGLAARNLLQQSSNTSLKRGAAVRQGQTVNMRRICAIGVQLRCDLAAERGLWGDEPRIGLKIFQQQDRLCSAGQSHAAKRQGNDGMLCTGMQQNICRAHDGKWNGEPSTQDTPASSGEPGLFENAVMLSPVHDPFTAHLHTGSRWPELAQSFAELGPAFSVPVAVNALPNPVLVASSAEAAALIGLTPPCTADEEHDWALAFGGHVEAICRHSRATVYAGHQFGNWAGQLGDGRALLLGDWPDQSGGAHKNGYPSWEIQFKGGGPTPFSRMGDGWAVLRSSIREFLCSEAMAALGVPTTRALCLVGSSRPVRRERMETAAMVTRLSPSFVRFGHFEHFSYSGQTAQLRQLTDWVIVRYCPQCAAAPQPALALLEWVVARTAHLIAQWQAVGFIHGVMNTDNMSILGWTIDYGPFAFLDGYDPLHTPNTTDRGGRYAYGRQPAIAHWNLLALGQALLPLIDKPEHALEAVDAFRPQYVQAMQQRLAAKLGLERVLPDDGDLFQDLLDTMTVNRSDWTLTFRLLADLPADPQAQIPAHLAAQFARDPQRFSEWVTRYRARLQAESRDAAARTQAMHAVNPAMVLRHHLAQAAIAQAEDGDFSEVRRLLDALRRPFDAQAVPAHYTAPPTDETPPARLSCSS